MSLFKSKKNRQQSLLGANATQQQQQTVSTVKNNLNLPSPDDAAIREAEMREKRKAGKRRGRASTLLTGPVSDIPVTTNGKPKASLLGGGY